MYMYMYMYVLSTCMCMYVVGYSPCDVVERERERCIFMVSAGLAVEERGGRDGGATRGHWNTSR